MHDAYLGCFYPKSIHLCDGLCNRCMLIIVYNSHSLYRSLAFFSLSSSLFSKTDLEFMNGFYAQAQITLGKEMLIHLLYNLACVIFFHFENFKFQQITTMENTYTHSGKLLQLFCHNWLHWTPLHGDTKCNPLAVQNITLRFWNEKRNKNLYQMKNMNMRFYELCELLLCFWQCAYSSYIWCANDVEKNLCPSLWL